VTRRLRILVADDEALVAAAIAKLLAARHDVTTTTTCSDALERIDRGEVFDVILCDVYLSDGGGIDIYERVKARPVTGAKVLFMSGGAFTPRVREFLQRTQVQCIAKPFNIESLEQLLQEAARTGA
jgi:CheY-like chemotaxis protein